MSLKLFSAIGAVSALIVVTGCGKKGPPLPPLVRIPAPPADFVAERRGDAVELQFTVPAANTDNTKPANIQRVDVYAFTGAAAISDADLLKYGSRVGSVDVKAPRDPNEVADPDEGEAEEDVPSPEGKGLDQGARAHVDEKISPAASTPTTVPKRGKHEDEGERPLLGPPVGAPPARTYLSVGITTRGRKGAVSKRVAVPLVPPPPPPSAPKVTYTETAVTVAWSPALSIADAVLPSHALGAAVPSFGYNVYQVPPPAAEKAPPPARLTKAPVDTTTFEDPRITWGEERCYAVRAAQVFGGSTVESEPTPTVCAKLVDTFAPGPPKGLTAVASQGSISLIWEPNSEPDLAGYIVLRGPAPGDTLTPILNSPITETTFKDDVQPGVRLVYAIVAVDKAGNRSAPSAKVEESAR